MKTKGFFRRERVGSLRGNTLRWIASAALFLSAFTLQAQTFTFNNWYALGSSSVTEADECGTVYRVNLNLNNWSPAHFQILKDGVPMSQWDLESKVSGLYYEAQDGQPAWRLKRDNSGQSWTEMFYINTRVIPYEVVSSIPTADFFTSKASVNKSVLTSPTEKVSLTGLACSNQEVTAVKYAWESSKDATTWAPLGINTADAEVALPHDSTYFSLVSTITYKVNDTLTKDTTVRSAALFVRYKTPSVSCYAQPGNGAKIFGADELEVGQNGLLNVYATTDDFSSATYCLQYKTLEAGKSAVWKDTLCGAAAEWKNMGVNNSSIFRVKVSGISLYSGKPATVYSSEQFSVRKVYGCDEDFDSEILWGDDFGSFTNSTTYVVKGDDGASVTYESKAGTYAIENYWAPDIFNRVKDHTYGLLNPLVINPTRDWCGKYRLDDGYYAIVPDPYKCDGPNKKAGQDYWNGEDHTAGDSNGGMLFVNCKAGLNGALIYEREFSLNCELNESVDLWLIFSAFINNATYKEESRTPVNVRLEILDKEDNLIHSVSSGDIYPRDHKTYATLTPDSWANLSFRFLAKSRDYKIRLYNNSEGGDANWGNDILIDDITVSLCYPNVELIESNHPDADTVFACIGEKLDLVAFNKIGLDKYIGSPKYLFQYKNMKTHGAWKDFGPIQTENKITLMASDTLREFIGGTVFRVFVASEASVLRDLASGKPVHNGCETIHAADSSLRVIYSQPFEMFLSLQSKAICLDGDTTEFKLSATPIPADVQPLSYYWYMNGDSIGCTEVDTFSVSLLDVDDYHFEVRAIDHCQTDINRAWKDSNKDTLLIREHEKLTLSVEPKEVALGGVVTLDATTGEYQGDLVWLEEGRKIDSTATTDLKFKTDVNGKVGFQVRPVAGSACVDPSDVVYVTVGVNIPNLITPYNDGLEAMNNTFLVGSGFPVEIYNRYHQTIYVGEDGWDGTYRGKIAEPGTYYYRVQMPNGEWVKGTLEVAKF
ncbi:MAG: gliding motility-associated C-terminal domain-containing protein [Paludibacteraceae bacterium]|nr:gliding motility-associated C-terminal domain-containing protein [Paludibacteraceae bacterium]